MPSRLGAHADRIGEVRDLLTVRGRREQQRFAFEGATLLDEALRSGVAIESIYATETSYEASPAIGALERDGTQIYLVDDRTAAKISDLQTPTGIVAVAPIVLASAQDLFEAPGLVLILADLNDPGNAGTLLRSAEAFGATAAVFGRFGVDPHHPKVVRGSMGAAFRLRLCVAEPPRGFRRRARTRRTPVGPGCERRAVAAPALPRAGRLGGRPRTPRLGGLGRRLRPPAGHSDARVRGEPQRRRSGLDRPLCGKPRYRVTACLVRRKTLFASAVKAAPSGRKVKTTIGQSRML